jgi:hypothetical protein
MKMTGADFVAWQTADWGCADAYWDEYGMLINDVEADDYDLVEIKPEDEITIHGGVVYLGDGKHVSAQKHFKRWKKAQTTETICVELPKECVEAFMTALPGFGAKVLKK